MSGPPQAVVDEWDKTLDDHSMALYQALRRRLPYPTVDAVRAAAADVKFGQKLVVNTDRGFLVELMVDQALRPEWLWLAREFTGWDFVHQQDGCRLESSMRPRCKPGRRPRAR
jgi:hypothetical protein